MPSLSVPGDRLRAGGTIIDRVVRRSIVTDLLLVALGTVVVSLLAQVEVPLYPVPVTGQTLGVLLVGATLGAWRGAASLGLYLVAGVAGLPVFAGFTGGLATVMKPSFGFIIGFVLAAAFIGWAAEHGWDRSFGKSVLAALGGTLIPFAVGLPYMAAILPTVGLPNDLMSVLGFGVFPFIIGGVVKWMIAAAALPLAWKLLGALEGPRR